MAYAQGAMCGHDPVLLQHCYHLQNVTHTYAGSQDGDTQASDPGSNSDSPSKKGSKLKRFFTKRALTSKKMSPSPGKVLYCILEHWVGNMASFGSML